MSASTPAGPPGTVERTGARAPAADGTAPVHDWTRLAETPEFLELHASRRRYTLIGVTILTAALVGVCALYGWAPDTMGKAAIGSITWALLSGAALVILTFVMALLYAHKSRSWEAMAERVLAHADEAGDRRTGRFGR